MEGGSERCEVRDGEEPVREPVHEDDAPLFRVVLLCQRRRRNEGQVAFVVITTDKRFHPEVSADACTSNPRRTNKNRKKYKK